MSELTISPKAVRRWRSENSGTRRSSIPRTPRPLLWLGEAHRRRGRLDEARSYMAAAIDLDPGYHDARLNLSGLLILMKRYGEAIDQAEALLQDATYEAPWRAYNNLGWAELQQGRFEQAKDAFEHALDFHEKLLAGASQSWNSRHG